MGKREIQAGKINRQFFFSLRASHLTLNFACALIIRVPVLFIIRQKHLPKPGDQRLIGSDVRGFLLERENEAMQGGDRLLEQTSLGIKTNHLFFKRSGPQAFLFFPAASSPCYGIPQA